MIELNVTTGKVTVDENYVSDVIIESTPHEPTLEERLQAAEDALLTLISMGGL